MPNVSEGRPEFEEQIRENEILPQSSSETSSDKEDSNVYSQSHIQIRTFFAVKICSKAHNRFFKQGIIWPGDERYKYVTEENCIVKTIFLLSIAIFARISVSNKKL